MNLPNKLTLGRIILVPFFVAALLIPFPFHNIIALLLFIAASITDTLDGKIARKMNLITDFGKFADPLADKILVLSALLCFIFAWNSFTFPLLLAGIKVEPITVAATKYLAQNTVHYGQMAVAATFSALPSIIFAICIQKHLVRGLSFGAVKG